MRREFTDEERARAVELLKTWTFPDEPGHELTEGDYSGMILAEVLAWAREVERPDLDKQDGENPA